MTMDEDEKFLSLPQVAERLGVNVRTVYRLIAAGELVMVKVGPRCRASRVPESWVRTYQQRAMSRAFA